MSLFTFQYQDPEHLKGPLDPSKLKPGDASFRIINAYTTDKDGNTLLNAEKNPYMQVQLLITDSEGNEGLVYDRIFAHWPWQVKQFLESVRLDLLYKDEGFDTTLLTGCAGNCVITVKEVPGKGTYTNIKRYLVPETKAVAQTIEQAFDDKIPF